MIMHGGDNGELTDYGLSEDFAFQKTQAELQSLDIGEGEQMPTLEELLQACVGHPNFLLNIEVKAPYRDDIFEQYDL